MKTAQTTIQATARSVYSAVSAGMIASLVDSILFTAARITGITSYNKEFLVAKIWVGIAQNPIIWLLGLILSVIMGGAIGWLYSLGFQAIRKRVKPGWDTGIALGVIHWLIGGTMMGYFSTPGYFGVELGWPTFVLLFLSHLLFGAIVGGLYVPPIRAIGLLEENDSENHEDLESMARKAS